MLEEKTDKHAISTPYTCTRKFQVTYEYSVHFCRSLFQSENSLLVDTLPDPANPDEADKPLPECVIVLDEGLVKAMPGLMQNLTNYASRYSDKITFHPPLLIPGGEECKNNPEYLIKILELMRLYSVDRHSFLMAVGGGALLDLAGLAAALFHRGVRLVRVPSTVLSQNDAGVGVKNSINLWGIKNMVGTFAPPFAVFNDFDLLKTLPPRDKKAGLAEAVKVALIHDPDFFYWIEKHSASLVQFDLEDTSYMIRHCARLHMDHIARGNDPFEKGNTRPLDFGHWIAHRLESLSSHEIKHGEAVAIGICVDNRYALLAGMLSSQEEKQIQNLIRNLGLPVSNPLLSSPEHLKDLLKGLDEFREHLGGKQNIAMLSAIGRCLEICDVNRELMSLAISQIGNEYTKKT